MGALGRMMLRARTSTGLSSIVAALCVAALASQATAAPAVPAMTCTRTKLLAVGVEAYGRMLCARRTDPTACARAAASRRDAVFRHVEKRGGCATENDAAAIGSDVEALVRDLVAAVAPGGSAGSSCAATELL